MKGKLIMMLEIVKYLKARYLSEKGQDLVEYALLLALVVVVGAVIVGGTDNIASHVGSIFNKTKNVVNNADTVQ